MNLVLHLSPELEAKLHEHSRREGKEPEVVALEAIDEKLAESCEPPKLASKEERLAAFRAFIASKPDGNPDADISRESIYP